MTDSGEAYPGEHPPYRSNADTWPGPVTPAARHAPGRVHNPSARMWRRVALFGMPVMFVVGVGVGAAPSAPERPTQRLTTVPAPPTVTPADLSPQTPPERTAASVPAERLPLADVGGDGAAATREYYSNCRAARQAGVAPIFDDEPGYRSGLDRDNDGVACE